MPYSPTNVITVQSSNSGPLFQQPARSIIGVCAAPAQQQVKIVRPSSPGTPQTVQTKETVQPTKGGNRFMKGFGFTKAANKSAPDTASEILDPDAISTKQADQLGADVEDLKLRFRISIGASLDLKRMLGVASGADEPEDDELPPTGSQIDVRKTDNGVLPSARCRVQAFRGRLLHELERSETSSSRAAVAFYAACRDDEVAAQLRSAHDDWAIAVAEVCRASSEQTGPGHGSTSALIERLSQELLKLQTEAPAESELMFLAWLRSHERLSGGLLETKVHLAAKAAREAFIAGGLGTDDVMALLRHIDEYHRYLAGGTGPLLPPAPGSFPSPADAMAKREAQTLAHLIHYYLAASKYWLPRVHFTRSTMCRRWAKRTVGALVHARFHAAHVEVAREAAQSQSVDSATEELRAALQDFRSLKYDQDSSFLLYFSGCLRPLQARGRPYALVLTCSFGGGHRAAANAVSSYLSGAGNADVHVLDTSKDSVFLEQDMMHQVGKWLGRPEWDQTTVFNDIILRRQLYGFVNISESLGMAQGAIMLDGRRAGLAGPIRSPDADSNLKRILRGQILSQHPDILVSVYHMDLNPIISLCEELGSLPLVHLATDVDIKMREVFGRSPPQYPKFAVGVPFDVPTSWLTVQPLSPTQVFLSGYPVRSDFLGLPLSAEASAAQRQKRGLDEDESLVLVMTGGGGQDVPWTEMLANSATWGTQNGYSQRKEPASRAACQRQEPGLGGMAPAMVEDPRLRIVIVCGANVSLAQRLQAVLKSDPNRPGLLRGLNQRVTVELAKDPAADPAKPYFVGASELVVLMDLASAAISKPGGGSTAELAYRGVPAVLDASKGAMHWEEFTINRLEAAGRGLALRSRNPAALEGALRLALHMGKDQSFACGPDSEILDTGEHLRRKAYQMSGLEFS